MVSRLAETGKRIVEIGYVKSGCGLTSLHSDISDQDRHSPFTDPVDCK